MLKRIILIIFLSINLIEPLFAATKEEIINNLIKTKNLTFDFKQTIDKKTEEGNCIIKYPKKIYCDYKGIKKKIIVSNGNSLVIKNRASKGYFLYPLDKTPLELILNKNLLLDKIERLETKLVNDKYYIFSLENDGNKINIFFDKSSYDLIGWQTEDIYQNLIITYIYNIKKNMNIDEKLFKLPKQH